MNALLVLLGAIVSLSLMLASGLSFVNPLGGIAFGIAILLSAIPMSILSLYISTPQSHYDTDTILNVDVTPNADIPKYDTINGLTFVGISTENIKDEEEPMPSSCATINEDCHANPFCTHWEEWKLSSSTQRGWLPGYPSREKYCVQKFGPFFPKVCQNSYAPKICNSFDSKDTTLHIHPRLYKMAAKSGSPITKKDLEEYRDSLPDRFKCKSTWCKFSEVFRWVDVVLTFITAPLSIAKGVISGVALGLEALTLAGGVTDITATVVNAKSTKKYWESVQKKVPMTNMYSERYREVLEQASKRVCNANQIKRLSAIQNRPKARFNASTSNFNYHNLPYDDCKPEDREPEEAGFVTD